MRLRGEKNRYVIPINFDILETLTKENIRHQIAIWLRP